MTIRFCPSRALPSLLLPSTLAVGLSTGCQGKEEGKPKAAATKAEAKAKTDAKANPHAGMPPHAMGKAPTPKGPPRDITPTGATRNETIADLSFAIPTEWTKGQPENRMRLAQYALPGPGGDGELVVFRFPGGAGAMQANIDRWKGQFKPPEGKSIDDVTQVKNIENGGIKTTLLDVSGTYATSMPGAEARNDANSRMLAAIVEGKGDPFYFKAVGPKKTMDLWAPAYETMIGTFKMGSAETPGADAKADTKADAKADTKADAKAG